MRRKILIGILVCMVIAGGIPLASGSDEIVTGKPDFDVTVSSNRIAPSDAGKFTVTVSNAGDIYRTGPEPFQKRVKTARNVKLTVQEEKIEAPIEIKSSTVTLGAVGEERPRRAAFRYETDDSLEPGTYRIPVELEYEHTYAVQYDTMRRPPGYYNVKNVDSTRSVTKYVTLVVEEQSTFSVRSRTTNVFPGHTGTLQFTVNNTGSETARNATIALQSGSASVFFGGFADPQPNASVYVSDLEPGESVSSTVNVGARPSTTEGTYPVTVQVVYENENEVPRKSDPYSIGVDTRSGQKFSVSDVETTGLAVGEDDALVHATVRNKGTLPVSNAVVWLRSPKPVQVTRPQSAVGNLPPGESTRCTFQLAIPENAEPGSQPLNFTVVYEDSEGDVTQNVVPLRKTATVAPERDEFEIVDVQTELPPGDSNTVAVEVKHTGDQAISTTNVKIFVNEPLTAPDNEAFLGEMEPGETKTAEFKLEASDNALSKEYVSSLQIRYDDADGDSELADGLKAGIPVAQDNGGLPLLYIGLGAGFVVIGGVAARYRRGAE